MKNGTMLHPTAVIATHLVSDNVQVPAHAVGRAGVRLGGVVVIHPHAVVEAAGAVATRDAAPGSTAVGLPASPIDRGGSDER